MTGIFIKGYTCFRSMLPIFAVSDEGSVVQFVFHPGSNFESNFPGNSIVGDNFELSNMRIFKIDGEIFQSAIFAVNQA